MNQKKIKILRIIARLNIGGPAIHTILLTQGLNPAKFSSLLVAGKEDIFEGNMLDLAQEKGVQPIFIPALQREVNLRKDWDAFWKIFWLIKKEKPHIVDTHTAKAGALGRLAAKLAGVPVIIHTFHGHTFYEYFSQDEASRYIRIERFLGSFTNRIIAVSKKGMEDLIRYRIAGQDKILHIPLGLELDKFLDCEKYRGELRKELGFNENDLLVGIVARLVPIKGHIYFLEAAKKVLEKITNVKFLIVGDGELRQELENYARKLGIADKVFWTGFRRDLPRVYADMDLVVLSSLNEGLPMTIIEAMSAAKPVVATDVGGVRELILDGETGVVVPPKNSDALARGIIDILSNSDRIKEMGKKARELAYPKYSIKRLVSDMESLYNKLIEERSC